MKINENREKQRLNFYNILRRDYLTLVTGVLYLPSVLDARSADFTLRIHIRLR